MIVENPADRPLGAQFGKSPPLIVRCLDCGHQWAALHPPIELFKAAKVLEHVHCPSCGAGPKRIVTVFGAGPKRIVIAPSA